MFSSSNFGFSSQSSMQANPENKPKSFWKDNSMSGPFRYIDPKTKKLKEEGSFSNGQQVGVWKEFDQDGDQVHYQYSKERVGALCRDGSTSSATGRGACSWHGGVAQWLYQSVKVRIGGTGKYVPIDERLKNLKQKIKTLYKLSKNGQELQQQIFKLVLTLGERNSQMEYQLSITKSKLQMSEKEVNLMKEKLALMENQIKDFKKKQRIQTIKANQDLKEKEKEKKLIITNLEKQPAKDVNRLNIENKKEKNIISNQNDKKQEVDKKTQQKTNKYGQEEKKQEVKKGEKQKSPPQKKDAEESSLSEDLGSDSDDWQDVLSHSKSSKKQQSNVDDSNDSRVIKDLLQKLRLS